MTRAKGIFGDSISLKEKETIYRLNIKKMDVKIFEKKRSTHKNYIRKK